MALAVAVAGGVAGHGRRWPWRWPRWGKLVVAVISASATGWGEAGRGLGRQGVTVAAGRGDVKHR